MRDAIFREDITDKFVKHKSAKRILVPNVESNGPVMVAWCEQLEQKIYQGSGAEQNKVFYFLFHSERRFPVVKQSANLPVQFRRDGKIAVPRVFEIIAKLAKTAFKIGTTQLGKVVVIRFPGFPRYQVCVGEHLQ